MTSTASIASPHVAGFGLPRGVFIMRHGEREDYLWKASGRNWQQAHDRPWDTPLTKNGHLQGAAGGRAVAAHCERLGLQPVKHVIVSPLLRCAQTGSAAAKELGIPILSVGVALAETMNEDWYRSWAVPGADSTWGGPPLCRKGVEVARESLHPAALGPARGCHASAEALTAMLRENGDPDMTVVEDDGRYQDASPVLTFNWDECESHEHQAARMKAICQGFFKVSSTRNNEEGGGAAAAAVGDRGEGAMASSSSSDPATDEGSVLLVSHGGPTSYVYCALTGQTKAPPTGYCGLYGYTWIKGAEDDEESKGRWEALVVSDHEHLKEVDAPISGPNDMVEQDLSSEKH